MRQFEAMAARIVLALIVVSGASRTAAPAPEPEDAASGSDIWTATANGDLGAIERQLAAGTDVNAKAPSLGVTPLMVAAIKGRSSAAGFLLARGAEPDVENDEGSTALHMAAFFGHTEIVKALVSMGADVNVRNVRSETPLDTVEGAWSEKLEGVYRAIGGALKLELDLDAIKSARPRIAARLAKEGGKSGVPEVQSTGIRGSYYVNGEIHVNTYGTPEGEPLTSGHWDFKPSWSKTGDMLVFFRRLKNDPVTVKWITAICVIHADGNGFQQLTNGTHTDFNPTWTRDGTNTPIWNRKNPETGGFYVMRSEVSNRPGQEVALTDKRYHSWAYTCLKDGRILVQSAHPKQGWGYYLLTARAGGEPRFQRIDCELATRGLLDRVSASPSETRVCFEYQRGFKYRDPGRTLYIADFDAEKRTITNPRPFANEEANPSMWFAYPRWSQDESAIVYHASGKLYRYRLRDGTTVKVSTNDAADYRYPHVEGAPK